jgi:hypothetical protein
MQVGLIADADIREFRPVSNNHRLADLSGAGGLALCCERCRAGRDMLVGLLFIAADGGRRAHEPPRLKRSVGLTRIEAVRTSSSLQQRFFL